MKPFSFFIILIFMTVVSEAQLQYPSTKKQTVTDCLAKSNVPYSTQEMEYTMKTISASS